MVPAEAFHAATGEQPKYLCAACNEAVFVIGEKIYRPCGCPVDTPVLANISAIAYGAGTSQS